jgi:GNAT superfamily N-acetyltransferase
MIDGPRPARDEELPGIIALSNDLFSPADGVDMGRAFPTLFTKDNAENLFVFVDEGSPVALAGITIQDLGIGEAVVRAACIGSVCTRASHRGRGLAARLTDECFAAASARGASLMLISGGRGLYRRIGCIDAGLFQAVRVDRTSRFPEAACRVRGWTESDLPDLQALHRGETVRFIRTPAVLACLLRSGTLRARPSRTWVVRVGEHTAAYLCISDATVREFAGSRRAVLGAAPAILSATGAESLEIEALASDAELVSLAAAFGLPSRTTGMDGTLKITDPRTFFKSISCLVPRGLSIECGNGPSVGQCPVVFRAGSESMTVSADGDLAALVFGSVEREAPEAGPAAAQGPLSSLLRAVFPLPLPAYGLNYI